MDESLAEIDLGALHAVGDWIKTFVARPIGGIWGGHRRRALSAFTRKHMRHRRSRAASPSGGYAVSEMLRLTRNRLPGS
jgi:hypothetical protein